MSLRPRCPHCGAALPLRRLVLDDLRRVYCGACPAVLSVRMRFVPRPAVLVLLFLVLLSPELGLAAGLAVFCAVQWIGLCTSDVRLDRLRFEPHHAG